MTFTFVLFAHLGTSSLAAGDPSRLAAEAQAANPGIAALQAQVAELEALANVAGAWPDPVAALEYANVPVTSWSLDGHGMAGVQLRAQQTIPFPGVPGLRVDVARSQVGAAEARLAEAGLRLRRATEESWWRLTLTRQLRQLTDEHVKLAQQLSDAARARYETGTSHQHGLVGMELLRDELRDSLQDYEREERQLIAALSSALHRELTGVLDTPEQFQVLALDPEDNVEDWLSTARQRRPALAELESLRRSAELSARLARRDARPDLTLWAGYRIRAYETDMDPGTDLVTLGLSLPLALQSARVGRGAEAAALEAAARAGLQHEALLDDIAAQLRAAHAAWNRAETKARTYQDELLPTARQALDSTLAAYRVGHAEFAALYQAQVVLLNLERARLVAVVETHLQDAAVRAITGAAGRPAAVIP